MSKYRIGAGSAHRKKYNRRIVVASILCLAIIAGAVYATYASANRPIGYAAQVTQVTKVTQGPKNEATSQPSVSPVVNYGLPDRLRIPKLAVDAPVTYMGLTKTGAMAVPDNIADVGWYKNGALPGNKGSAVLAGHIDGLKGEPGVFAHLNKLQKGDTLQVIDSNNSTISFRVKNIQTYGQDEQPSEVFNTVDGVHLNLITCTGVWDSTQHHFLERLVVFTDKV